MTDKNKYIKCSGCGEMIEVPAELYPEPIEGEIPLSEPYYCDECESQDEIEAELFFEFAIEEDEEGEE